MNRRTTLSVPLQVLLWAGAASAGGAVVGLVIGIFRDGAIETPLIVISVLFGNVVGLTVWLSSVVLFPRLRTFAPAARFVVLGLALAAGAAAGTALVLGFYPLFILRDPKLVVAIGAVNVLLALLVGGVAYVYEGMRAQLAETLREMEEVRLVEARLEEQAARAELAALQARINPHFFFNTLNTISSLLEEDPDEAEEILGTLGELFRYTFKVAGAGPVPLDEELRFIEGYLGIEQARFGDRLRVIWEIEAHVRRCPVPGLLLQPLVENAVLHGLAPVPEGGSLRIAARRADGGVTIEIEDDGVGHGHVPERVFREGHGLDNVRQRIDTLYRGRGSIRLDPGSSGRGTVVRVVIPSPASSAGTWWEEIRPARAPGEEIS
jgi:two-component sensor histidine kinase